LIVMVFYSGIRGNVTPDLTGFTEHRVDSDSVNHRDAG